MAPLKVLIIGGGVAGPALAYWLSRIGAKITLIERSPHVRATGQQVDLRAQGIPMMKKMGIEEAIRAVVVREPGTQLIDVNGKTKAFFAASPGGGKQSITSEIEIMRGDLVRVLFGLTENRPNVKYLFNMTIDSFTQDDESDPNGKVHVKFHDGRKEDFDLVVAADGTGSKTRKMMLGSDAPDPRHPLGGYIGYFSILSQPGDSDVSTMCHLPGTRMSRILMTRKDRPDLLRVYMLLRGKDTPLDAAMKSGKLVELKNALGDIYQDGAWQSARFVEALRSSPEADDLYCTPFEEIRLPKGSWSKGRVVLLGDAAHSATADGFGCTWGLVGAYILAGEIASLLERFPESWTTAIVRGAKNYEEIFRPVATSKQGDQAFVENLLFPRSNFGISALHTFARVAAFFRLDQGAGLSSKMEKWPVPEYAALDKEHV